MAFSLSVEGKGFSFWVVSGQSSCLAHIWSDSGSFLVSCESLNQDGFQYKESGSLAGRNRSWLLFPPLAPPKFFQLAVACPFLMGTSCEILSAVITLPGQGGWFPMVP